MIVLRRARALRAACTISRQKPQAISSAGTPEELLAAMHLERRLHAMGPPGLSSSSGVTAMGAAEQPASRKPSESGLHFNSAQAA
jgi:hypothetical protein